MTKKQEIQKIFRLYRDETGETDLDMKEVVQWAVKRLRYQLPEPVDPLDQAAKEFSAAAREETREDEETHQAYRANHAYTVMIDGKPAKRWLDIDGEAPRFKMIKCATERKDQMVGDGLQLTLDLDHWHRIHPEEERIAIDMDLTDEIEWRKNAPPDRKKKAS